MEYVHIYPVYFFRMFTETQRMKKDLNTTQRVLEKSFSIVCYINACLFVTRSLTFLISWSLDSETITLVADLCGSQHHIMGYFITVSTILCECWCFLSHGFFIICKNEQFYLSISVLFVWWHIVKLWITLFCNYLITLHYITLQLSHYIVTIHDYCRTFGK